MSTDLTTNSGVVASTRPTIVMLQKLKVAVPIPTPVPPVTLFIYPPPPITGGIKVTSSDLCRLNEGTFINDTVIDFYLKYVFYEKLSPDQQDKCHIFSSFFFARLTQKLERPCGEDAQKSEQLKRHNLVKNWTRRVDIFSKDFIVIPINNNRHWFLAIICYPGLIGPWKEPNSTVDDCLNPVLEESMPEAPDKKKCRKEAPCICIFDSLNKPNRSRHTQVATVLREYLEVEWKMKKGTRKIFEENTVQSYVMQCPQQDNYTDCGIYLLQYVESFFESPLPYFDSPIPNLSNWFPKERVAKKRQELKDLILALKKKYGSNTPTSTCS